MQFFPLPIPGAFRVEIECLEDERGFFARTYSTEEFRERGLLVDFAQRSVSFNKRKATLRGLHYQVAPYAETKIVTCTAGAAFDVLVDLRRSSPTFGRWHAETITADNHAMVYIPAGCAHGFQTLADDTELAYSISPNYVPGAARGLAFDDIALAIEWPLPDPILSAADQRRPPLAQAEIFK